MKGAGPRRYTGVHLTLKRADTPRTLPAGWPYPHLGSIKPALSQGMPICVLGPMTEQQRTALNQALVLYGGQLGSTEGPAPAGGKDGKDG